VPVPYPWLAVLGKQQGSSLLPGTGFAYSLSASEIVGGCVLRLGSGTTRMREM
jgi:hypothetical protein